MRHCTQWHCTAALWSFVITFVWMEASVILMTAGHFVITFAWRAHRTISTELTR
jgi:hypothetical protein